MKRVLFSFLIAGGVVYAINTWLLPNTSRLFDDGEKQVGEASSNQAMPMPRREEQQTDRLTPPVDANSPHAITVEENPLPPPAKAEPPPALEQKELPPIASQLTTPSQIELVKVTSRASIQEGPSASTPIIGIAHPGAAAQVISRDSEWAQIIDPASKKTGWIHSRFLEPQTQAGSTPGQLEAALDTDEVATTTSARPETSLRSKKSGKHGWKRKRHRRGFALRYRLRRFF
jgi:uncharacterized protein YraI